jgi:ATP-dependent Clp protease ATP-binding subunit ClpB
LFHKVKIHDSALVSAVTLSDRYITDRFLPDKAIDLIDEACAKIKTEMHSLPAELDSLKRQIIHKKTELASLSKENDDKSKSKIVQIEEELSVLEKKQAVEIKN